MGFWICRGYEVAERGGGRVANRRAMSLDMSAVLRYLPIYTIYKNRLKNLNYHLHPDIVIPLNPRTKKPTASPYWPTLVLNP